MDGWQLLLSRSLENFQRLQVPSWLAMAALVASFVLLLALIVMAERYLSLRRRLGPQAEKSGGYLQADLADPDDPPRGISLEGEGRAVVDNLLPRRPFGFLWTIVALAAGCWFLGLLLTSNMAGFLASTEWQLQPLYLAAHFITLRLFTNAFTRYFQAGAVHLEVSPANARRGMRLIMGPIGALVAVALAFPFCIYDYGVLFSGSDSDGLGVGANRLLVGMWCVEWFLIAFIWVMLVGFLLLTRWTVGEHRFRAPIEVVLHAKQYRPFLQMSAQGATIVLLFCIVNAVYVWYTGGEASDYIGALITLALLVVGFVPPWLQLRGKVNRAVHAEMASLRSRLTDAISAEAVGKAGTGPPQTAQELQERLDEVLVMLRISYLERLYRDLGQSEAINIIVKLLVPATTMLWYVMRYLKWVN